MQSVACQRLHWPDHRPSCDGTVSVLVSPLVRPLTIDYPDFIRDIRHYGPAIMERVVEATILALDIPNHPVSYRDVVLSIGIRYDPEGPRDIQRFEPLYCRLLSTAEVRSCKPDWAEVVDRRDRDEVRARAAGHFGMALIQLVYHSPMDVDGTRGPFGNLCTFERLRLRQAHATVPGDPRYAYLLLTWMAYLKGTGDLTPSKPRLYRSSRSDWKLIHSRRDFVQVLGHQTTHRARERPLMNSLKVDHS